MEMEIIPMAM